MMEHPQANISQQIAQVQATLEQLRTTRDLLPPEARASLNASIQTLQDQLAVLLGQVEVSGSVQGPVVGVNTGIVLAFYGMQPPADAKPLLDSYLAALLKQHSALRLGRLLEQERNSREQTNAPALSLQQVYTSIATNATIAGASFDLPFREVQEQIRRGDPDQVLPEHVRLIDSPQAAFGGRTPLLGVGDTLVTQWQSALATLQGHGRAPRAEDRFSGRWLRPEVVVEAIATQTRLVLLGDPGSGKSTALRYLALMLADALRAGRTSGLDLLGWQDRRLPVPIVCSLGEVGKRFSQDPATDRTTLVTALLEQVTGGEIRAELRASMLQAWNAGSVILLLDGLDEVSAVVEETVGGRISRRERMADAIRWLAQQLASASLVVTCRTKPYQQDAAWQLRDDWTIRRLEPWTLGQIRHFVRAWYHQASQAPEPRYPPSEADERAVQLIAAIGAQTQLREIAASPLLLTMLALLHYNNKQLPPDRADVYEALVKLLLERWEGMRSSERALRRPPLGERLGLPHVTTEHLRQPLYRIAYRAHGLVADGRGIVTHATLDAILNPFFAQMIDPVRPEQVPRAACVAKTEAFVALLCAETGLLQAEEDGSYAFPHLTFQEYLAACYLAAQDAPLVLYAPWREQGDRWREPLLLLMRRLVIDNKLPLAYSWLLLLLQANCEELPKTSMQAQRDGILAAACYDALGRGRTLASGGLAAGPLETSLRERLLDTLNQPDPALALPQRAEAGTGLGLLDDPRYPVTNEAWRWETEQRSEQFGQPRGYWCWVPGGTYRIGGWNAEAVAAEIALAPFWIGRFPVTVAPFAPFVEAGYTDAAERWWTPEGWRWMRERKRTQPWLWNESGFNGLNQPVIGVTWYEATAWAAWLTEQLADVLPPGYVVRLPTEAEWEAAAAFDGASNRWPYPWGEPEPTPVYAVYESGTEQDVDRSVPVGCCPAGAAACGALDLAGNVWEWTASAYDQYPAESSVIQKDFTPDSWNVPLRGGAYYSDSTDVRCGARFWYGPDDVIRDYGFRVVVAARLAWMF